MSKLPAAEPEQPIAGQSLGPERLAQLMRRAPRNQDGQLDVTAMAARLLTEGLQEEDLEMFAANLLENGTPADRLEQDLTVVRAAFEKVRHQLAELARAALGQSRLAVVGSAVRLLGKDAPDPAPEQEAGQQSQLKVRVRVDNLTQWWSTRRAEIPSKQD